MGSVIGSLAQPILARVGCCSTFSPQMVWLRTSVLTDPPARTVQVPGASQAFRRSELVEVSIPRAGGGEGRSGRVRRPSLLAAIIGKAAATTIAVRTNPERDWQDAALLPALVDDPIAAAAECTTSDRRKLRLLRGLQDRDHVGWDGIDDLYSRGSATVGFLLANSG